MVWKNQPLFGIDGGSDGNGNVLVQVNTDKRGVDLSIKTSRWYNG